MEAVTKNIKAYPMALAALCAILVVIIIYLIWSNRAPSRGQRGRRNKVMSADEELDDLVDSIHEKQKLPTTTQ